MTLLNKEASEVMQSIGANSCTDITGFGLLGHACEMCLQSEVGMKLDVSLIPLLPKVTDFAKKGILPGGAYRNKEFRLPMIETGSTPGWLLDVLFDPQTSGGLLISAPPANARKILSLLHQGGHEVAAIIGQVTEQPKGKIILA
jgi:selenide,water dikinase